VEVTSSSPLSTGTVRHCPLSSGPSRRRPRPRCRASSCSTTATVRNLATAAAYTLLLTRELPPPPLECRSVHWCVLVLCVCVNLDGAGTGNASWVAAAKATAVEGKSSVAVTLPAAGQGPPLAIRYAWKDVPDTQLLYDSSPLMGGKMSGLPAPPFYANCSSSSSSSSSSDSVEPQLTGCELITPGELPPIATGGSGSGGGGHHPPSPPSPPAPPAPPSTGCSFSNHTTIAGVRNQKRP
jgi:hypothetical protein